jgi:hypothetical protein
MLFKTRFGYEVRVIGENPDAAKYAGIDFTRTTVLIMIISGGMAGLAGVGEVAGIHHYLSYPDTISSGYGFTAIIVAWLAKLNPCYRGFFGDFFRRHPGWRRCDSDLAGTAGGHRGDLQWNPAVFLIMGDFFTKNRVRLLVKEKV